MTKKDISVLKEERIKEICQKTDWSRKKAAEALHLASKQGINSYYYMKNEGWTLSAAELEALSVELKEKKQKREALKKERIQIICEETGWGEEKASREMEKAKEFGISNRQYTVKHLFQLSEDELQDYSQLVLKNKDRQRENTEYIVDIVSKKTEWDRDKTIEEMDKAKAIGISNLKYVQNACWDISDSEKKALAEALDRDKTRINNNKIRYVDIACKATGWTKGKVELEALRAKVNCGASYEDFSIFKLYELSAEEQKKYATLDMFNKMRMKYNDHFIAAKNFDDKAMFNTHFKDLIKHKWFVNEDLSYEKFLDNISGLKKVIIKPLAATQGIGIEVFPCNVSEEKNRELYDYLCSLPKTIIEEYIIQHEEVMGFCETSVNTLRIMTLNYQGECKFLYSVLRMGRGDIVDNFHAGGVAASVDLETGIVYSNAADLDGNVFETAPATGKIIKGFQIPHWDMIIETCKKANGRVEGANLVGWDFAITPDGIDLIEGNPGASYVVAQIPNVEDRIGLADVMATPYL